MFPLYLIDIIDLIVYILLIICINNFEVYCKVINIILKQFFFNTYVIFKITCVIVMHIVI